MISLEQTKKVIFLPLLSAVLLAFSFENFSLAWIFTLFGLVPLLFFLALNENWRVCFLGGWLAGTVFYAAVIRWFLNAFPPVWAGVQDEGAGLLLVGFVWLGSSAVLGLSFAIFAVFTRLVSSRGYRDLISIPSCWIISQYAAAWLFNVWSWGPGTSWGPHWTLGNIGYALVYTPLVYLSRWTGLYGISFIAVAINVLFFLGYYGWRRGDLSFFHFSKGRRLALFLGGMVAILFLLFPWGIATFSKREEDRPLRVVILQTHFSGGSFYLRSFAELYRASRDSGAIREQPDIIIFPEDSQFFSFVGSEEKELLNLIFPDKSRPGLIITSATAPVSNQGRKKFVYYRNEQGELLSREEKSFLIPTGEFMPSLLRLLILLSRNQDIDKAFSEERALYKGEKGERPIMFGGVSVGTLLCSGVVSPVLYNALSRSGADILINSASHAIFKGDPYFLHQIKLMARFQAISNEKPFIQASNGGLSYVLNQDGEVIAESKNLGNLILSAEVTTRNPPSYNLYIRFGDWPVLLALLNLFVASRRLLWKGLKG